MDAVIEGSGPEEIERRLAEWTRGLEQKAERYRVMREATDTIRVTESTSDGAVSVTVDATGQLVDIATTAAIGRHKPERIGAMILASVKRAQGRLAGRVGTVMRETLGEQDPTTARMVEQYRQRFPEPAEEADGAIAPFLEVGAVEDDDPPPVPPRPAPRLSRPARSRPAADEDDWGDESIMQRI